CARGDDPRGLVKAGAEGMYKHAGRFLQALARREHQPPRRTQWGESYTSYTLNRAAKATGRSKATIYRAIKNHTISATKHAATGSWSIDPAELHRVFPAVSDFDARKAQSRLVKRLHKEVNKVTTLAKADFDSRKTQPGLVKR